MIDIRLTDRENHIDYLFKDEKRGNLIEGHRILIRPLCPIVSTDFKGQKLLSCLGSLVLPGIELNVTLIGEVTNGATLQVEIEVTG